MSRLPEQNKKRFKITIFIVLPLCFIIGFFISIKLVSLLNYKIDLKGAIFVSLSFLPLYIISVIVVYRKLQKKTKEKNQIR
jgi:uncharacterized BrkB/YihY/UPF0761 family membrane protein